MLVIDTSVAIKWYLRDEDCADQALALMDRRDLHAPDLLRIEFANAIVRRSRRAAPIPPPFGRGSIDAFLRVPIRYHPIDLLINAITDLALQYDLHVYDATFVATALALRCPLVTADRRLIATLEDTAFHDIVRSLDDPWLFSH